MIRLLLFVIITFNNILPLTPTAAFRNDPPAAATIGDPYLTAQAAAMRTDYVADVVREDWDRYTLTVRLNPAELRLQGEMSVRLTNRSDVDFGPELMRRARWSASRQ